MRAIRDRTANSHHSGILPRRFQMLAGIVAVCLCALACGNKEGEGPTASWTIRDSAGVEIVSNLWDGSSRGCVVIDPEPTTVVAAGAEFGNLIPPFYKVRGGVVLSDGRIVVLNAGNDQLLFFDADGKFQQSVGRSGRGPGEFIDARWLGVGGNDSLFVWDSGQNRLSIFGREGELLLSHQVKASAWNDVPGSFGGRFADGSFYVTPASLVFFDGTPGVVRLPETHGRYDLEMGEVEALESGNGLESVSHGGFYYVLPFGKDDVAIAHADALVIGDNGMPTLNYYDMKGELRRIVEWLATPISVTERDRFEYVDHYNRGTPAHVKLPANIPFATERPTFSSLRSDLAGWLWVRTFAGSWEPRGHWLVFDEDGVLRCSVNPPPPRLFSPLQIGETHMLVVQWDEDYEETVVLYELARNDS